MKGWAVGEDKGYGLAGLDREITDRSKIFAVEFDRGSQEKTIWAANRVDRAVVKPVDPWHRRPIVEAHHKLCLKSHSPRPTRNNPHEIGTICRGHEIDNRRTASLSLEFGFKDEGAGTVAPSHAEGCIFRRNEPAAVFGFPE